MPRNADSGARPPGSAGTHLGLLRAEEQGSGHILAGPKNVLHELPAPGTVYVVLGSLGIVSDGR